MEAKNSSLAHQFADYSASRLANIGFSVDEIAMGGPYDASDVRFRTDNDFYLTVSFAPYDTGTATTRFGRMWESDDGWMEISNYLHAFSDVTNIEFPESHAIAASYERLPETYESILSDLESVLPTLLRSVTLSQLDAIEARQFGAIRSAKVRYGANYIEKIRCKGTT